MSNEHVEEAVISLRLGDKFPNLPEEYYAGIDNHPPGMACLIADSSGQEGMVAFVKNGVLIAIRHVRELPSATPPMDHFDAIVMHPDDIPPDALERASVSVKKYYN